MGYWLLLLFLLFVVFNREMGYNLFLLFCVFLQKRYKSGINKFIIYIIIACSSCCYTLTLG